jgi:hypothetical protein
MKVLQQIGFVLILAAPIIPRDSRAELEFRMSDKDCVVHVNGEITLADAEELLHTDCPNPWIVLNDSPGGDVYAGMWIGRWIREHQAITSVHKDAHCYSTCALLFIAGVDRINGGVIGLHRPYLAGPPQPADRIPALVSKLREDVNDYILEMGARPEFASTMLETVPESMHLYYGDEIHELVAERDTVYDEIKVAEDARHYGVSTQEYRQRDQEVRVECDLNRFIDVSRGLELWKICEEAIRWGLRESVYLRRRDSFRGHCGHVLSIADANEREAEILECRIAVMRGALLDVSGLDRVEEAELQRRRQAELDAQDMRLAALSANDEARWAFAIQQQITRNFIRPASAPEDLECVVDVRQLPGGQVVNVDIGRCNGDESVRRSIEAAVFKTSPLPSPENPNVFDRDLRIIFKPEQ